jgi:hypothetical protein
MVVLLERAGTVGDGAGVADFEPELPPQPPSNPAAIKTINGLG